MQTPTDQLLQVTLASIGDAIITTDKGGRIAFLNPVAEGLTGWSLAEARGQPLKTVFRVIHEGTRQPVESPALLALQRAAPARLARRSVLLSKDGTEVPIDDTAAPILDAESNALGVVIVFQDVTERRRTERQLRRQNEGLRLLWETAGVLLREDDPHSMLRALFGRIRPYLQLDLYFNFLLNESADALELVSCAGVPEGMLPSMQRLALGDAICGKVAQERRPIVATFIQQSDDPRAQLVKQFGVRAYACNPLLAGDRLLGTLSFASRTRDEFDEDEIAVIETITHYVTFAYERMQHIRALQQNNLRKDEFLAMLGHELRNPLSAISNGIEVLRMGRHDEAAQSSVLDILGRQTNHIVRLIDDLLDASRIMRGKIEVRKERICLQWVVADAVEMVRPLLDDRSCNLRQRVQDEEIWLDADSVRLAQVIGNLITNAAKYSAEKCCIDLFVAQEHGTAVIRIRDYGIGISPAQLKRVFEPFVQLQRALDRSDGGLGIGLTLVHSLVEMHGGRIEAHSEGEGQGSEFAVYLPLADPAPPGQAVPEPQVTSCSSNSLPQ